jgi:hypothetical protein
LQALWRDSGPGGRQTITSAIFARTDVLGFQRLEYELTADAMELGLDAALPARFELGHQSGEFGRGERYCAVMSDAGQIVRFERANALQRRLLTG